MAQRLSEQVVEWLTVGGDAFTPQNFNSTNGNVTLAVSAPGETISIPATSGGPIGIYNNKGQLWTLGAAGATSSVKSSQLIVSSSDAAAGTGAALELWRGTDVSWQLRADNSTDELIIANNWTTAAQTSYTSNVSFGYGTVANQYVHIYSTLDSNYSYGGASGSALSVAGGITAAKKIYFSDTTDSNYATKAGALVVEGGVNIAKKVYLRDTTDSNYATVAGSFVTMGGAYIKKKTYIADTTDSNYSTKAGALVIEGGAYIGKKVYLKDTTDSSSTSTGALVVSGGVGIAKKLYVGSDFTQTGDTALIQSNVIRLRNKSANNNQAGTYPYITSLSIGDSTEITLDEYKDGYLSIHGKSGILLYPQTSQPAVYDATNTYSVGTVVWYNKEYYRCTTAITEAQAWTAANWTKLPTASGSTWSHGNIYPTITNNYALGSSSYRWKSLEIGTASSYGSGTQPIYWSSGVPTASTSTVGSGVKPIYLSSGTLTVSSSTVGGTAKPIYMSSGELKAISDTVGSGVKPIYLSSGTITVSSSTVGSGVKPVYLSSGTITVSSSSVGGTAKPVYLSSGEIKAISDTVGTATKPVYLSSGTITVGSYELKATINAGTAKQVAYYSGANAISGNSNLTIDGTTLSIGGYSIGPAAGTYGTIDCMTAKSSYYGITSGPGNDYLTLMSHTGKQHQGLYNTAKGKWAFYYDATNNRVGIGTSSTTSGYLLTVTGGIYCDNTIRAGGGHVWSGTSSASAEKDTGAEALAGKIYLYSGGSATGNRGIYLTNNAGTGGALMTINQSNQISAIATMACAVTITGTLTLSKTQDAAGNANNSPALIIGGAATAQHIEIDGNEIISKSNGTTAGTLYLQDGGTISLAGVLQSNTTNYGSSLPTSGLSTGRIFFKTV